MDLYYNRIPPRSSHNHELKRPDSVITTSSIVSSDTASQAGDSSTEASIGPPSAYAISGLYGSIQSKKPPHRRRTHSGSLGINAESSVQNNPVPGSSSGSASLEPTATQPSEHLVLSKSNSCATNSVPLKIHKRQTSHPAAISGGDKTLDGAVTCPEKKVLKVRILKILILVFYQSKISRRFQSLLNLNSNLNTEWNH